MCESGPDRPAHIIEELLYEIQRWDVGRDLTDTQLAERLFDTVAGVFGSVGSNECPDARA